MVGRMERQTASSSASCSPSAAAAASSSSSSVCGGKKRPDILNMIRVRLNLLTLALLPFSACLDKFILFSIHASCLVYVVLMLILQKKFLVNRSVRVTLMCINNSSRQNRLGALQRQFLVRPSRLKKKNHFDGLFFLPVRKLTNRLT
jgi:hypothetical protein